MRGWWWVLFGGGSTARGDNEFWDEVAERADEEVREECGDEEELEGEEFEGQGCWHKMLEIESLLICLIDFAAIWWGERKDGLGMSTSLDRSSAAAPVKGDLLTRRSRRTRTQRIDQFMWYRLCI